MVNCSEHNGMFSGIFGILRFTTTSTTLRKVFHAPMSAKLKCSIWPTEFLFYVKAFKKSWEKNKNLEWNSISRTFSMMSHSIHMLSIQIDTKSRHVLSMYIATSNANKTYVLTFWLIMKMKDVLPCDDWIMSYGSLAHGHIDEGLFHPPSRLGSYLCHLQPSYSSRKN